MASPRTPNAASQPLQLHTRCEITNLGRGEVLFVGQTSFAAGVWVGVHLDNPNGKNDGTVHGKRYFHCEDKFGVFVRPSLVHPLAPEDELRDVHDRFGEEASDLGIEDEAEPLQRSQPERSGAAMHRAPAARTASPRKSLATPASRNASALGSARPRPSLGGASTPSVAGRPRPSAASAHLTIKRATSPTKPTIEAGSRTPLTSSTRPGTASATSIRPALHSATVSRTASPITPATSRVSRATAALTAGRTSAGLSRLGQPPSNPAAPATANKAQTPSAARAGLRPVLGSRPSMASSIRPAAASNSASSPSAAAAARVSLTRSQSGPGQASTLSAPLSRAGSATSVTRSEGGLVPGHTSEASRSLDTTNAGRRAGLDDEDGLDDGPLLVSEEDEQLLGVDMGEDGSAAELPDLEDPDTTISAVRSSRAVGGVQKSASVRSLAGSQKNFMSLASGPSPASLRGAAELGPLQRELQELRAKVRILEKKKEEDREKMREMERAKVESEQVLTMKPQMDARIEELQAQVSDLQKLEKDWDTQKDGLENQISVLTDDMEHATLDREIAEEELHLAKKELNELKLKVEELELDKQILKEEMAIIESNEANDEGRSSVAYIQVMRHNEKLKDGLLWARDLLHEKEAQHRKRVSELEKELADLQELQSSYDEARSDLTTKDAQIEDLKAQLDAALHSEVTILELSERNMQLTDRVAELRAANEDLVTLNELSDQIDELRVLNEKDLQQEVDQKDLQIRDEVVKNEALKATIADYEDTFGQFRELVANLQSDLETLRAEQSQTRGVNDEAGKDLTSQSQAMLNLNMKLQSSALKSQAKTIELELDKLSAVQASSRLDMTKPYLPAAFFETDADAVNCLLFFQRMAYKADLIKMVVENKHNIQESLASIVPEQLVSICQMRHNLAHFAALSRQIAAVLRLAPVEVFLKAGRMYRENLSVEKRIDVFIEALRREELKEIECGQEFSRFIKQFEDFSMALGGDENDSDLAAKEVGSATLIDHDLDTLIAALGFAKQSVAGLYNDDDVDWELGTRDLEQDIFEPLQSLINDIKVTKVPTRKMLRRLLSLSLNDEAVKMEAVINLPPLGQLTSQLVTFATHLSNRFAVYVAEVKVSKAAFDLSRAVDFINEATQEGLGKADITIWSSPLQSTSHLSSTINSVLSAIVEQENVIKISGPGPWLARVEQIKSDASHNVEAERQVSKLNDEARDLYRQIKARDQAMRESSIKLERMQKQVEKSKEQSDQIDNMRSGLVEALKQSKAYQEAHDALQAEIDVLQQDNDRLRQQAIESGVKIGVTNGSAERGASGDKDGVDSVPVISSSLETSQLVERIEALRAGVKYLRNENMYLKTSEMARKVQLFSVLPVAADRTAKGAEAKPTPSSSEEEETKIGGKIVGLPSTERLSQRPKGKVVGGVDLRVASDEISMLSSQVAVISAEPKVVSVSNVNRVVVGTPSKEGQTSATAEPTASSDNAENRVVRAWRPLDKLPSMQFWHQMDAKCKAAAKIKTLESTMRSAAC